MPDPDPITCKCGALLGYAIQIDGVQLFQVGGLLVEELHGRCVQCGAGVHTSLPTRAYARLMRHYGQEFALTVEITARE